MELSPTAYVILGMLGWRPMSGYEIKSIVDKSTRFFWAASYGQIYPELRRLAAAGLIEGKASPQGGRKRNVYRLTQAGRKQLRAWLDTDPQVYELRDEALLKLFFANATGGASAASTLAAKRRTHEQIVAATEGDRGDREAGGLRVPRSCATGSSSTNGTPTGASEPGEPWRTRSPSQRRTA